MENIFIFANLEKENPMTRFIKIFTIMTGLTLMTACGASGLLDDAKNLLDQARAALTAEIKRGELDTRYIAAELDKLPEGQREAARERITNEAAGLTLEQIEAALNLSEDDLAEIDRDVEFKAATVGLNPEQQDARVIACRAAPQTEGCAGVLVRWCYDTPFDTACNVNPDATRRVEYIAECGVGTNVECIDDAGAVCTANSSITGCADFVPRACGVNPLYDLCDTAEYFLARDNFCWIQGRNGGIRTEECAEIVRINRLPQNAIPSCRANYVAGSLENGFNPRCFNVVTAACDLNPFDVLCERNTNYLNTRPARIAACRNRVPNALFCDHATTFRCDENPFDALCLLDYTTNDYASERQTAINDCQTTFVAGEVCEDAAEQFCGSATGEGLFSALCLNDSASDVGRRPLCVSERVAIVTVGDNPITARCATTATRLCDANPLDPLCEDVTAYRARQISACVVTPTHSSCANGAAQFSYITPIIACLENPFGADCINPTTEAGAFFADNLEEVQESYCESGGARTTSTTVETTVDHVNCTNIGSLPVFADLARNITKNGIRTFGADRTTVTANAVTTQNPNIGGFLRAGVFGPRLGDHKGVKPSGGRPGTFTDENNNGNFDRYDEGGDTWLGFSDIYSLGDPAEIWDVASTIDPNDGFTYFIAENDEGALLSYAGIWQTTNFGAPLAAPVNQEPTSAIWAGHFTAYSGATVLNATPTNFYVDFAAGTFNVHNPDGTDNNNPDGIAPKTGSVIAESRSGGSGSEGYVSGRFIYTVNGIFGVDKDDPNVSYTNGGVARKLNPGELSGDVTLVNTVYSAENVINTNRPNNPATFETPLIGLIGVEGAVGVFLNPETNFSANVGGFTAAPTPAN